MATAFLVDEQRATRLASGFVASLQEPKTPYISPKRVAHVLGVQLSRLAEIAGVHRNTLANPASERLQDRLRDMVRVIVAASAGCAMPSAATATSKPVLIASRPTPLIGD